MKQQFVSPFFPNLTPQKPKRNFQSKDTQWGCPNGKKGIVLYIAVVSLCSCRGTGAYCTVLLGPCRRAGVYCTVVQAKRHSLFCVIFSAKRVSSWSTISSGVLEPVEDGQNTYRCLFIYTSHKWLTQNTFNTISTSGKGLVKTQLQLRYFSKSPSVTATIQVPNISFTIVKY